MEKKIAKILLEIGAVFLRPNQPFTWASGIKSPVYCDNRLILSYPQQRTEVENSLVDLIKTHFADTAAIMGTATAGIAHAAIVSNNMNLPMGYVRSSSKEHGRNNRIEGKIERGQKVVVVEDLISTAGSSIEVVETLRDAGAMPLGIVSIFTYNMKKGLNNLSRANIKSFSLCNFDTLVEVAADNGFIQKSDVERLLRFRDNPSDESWIRG